MSRAMPAPAAAEVVGRMAAQYGLEVEPEVPASQLTAGRYWMQWSSYWQRVDVLPIPGSGHMGYRSASGMLHDIRTVPGAHWYPIRGEVRP